ncbi:MAG: HlyD family efflux transporter periplasmic adaptor subunit [Candidatus Schekmanbacteria bacterium]|nr:MAG: HlyD family efflux transporter periplasmic adaptor subunit [Candidatus Schekmanbacteria bacterium]
MNNSQIKIAFIFLLLSFHILSCIRESGQKRIIEATGTIESTEVEVRSKTFGTIEKIMFKEGKFVEKGDLLCLLDTEENEINLKKMEAKYRELLSKYELLKSGYREYDVKRQQAVVREIEEKLEDAERNFRRIDGLYKKGFASRQEYDSAETEVSVLKKQLEEAKSQYALLREGYRREDIESALAAVKEAEAEIELIKKKIRDASIRAPISGIITEKLAEKGEFLREGMPVALITDLDDTWLTIYISETDIGAVKQGQNVRVKIDTFPEREFKGKVSFISPQTEFTPKNIQTKSDRIKLVYEVRVMLENKERIFKPGMIADAYIDVNQ